LPPSLVFLIDDDRLLEIDLRGGTVRSAHESPGIESVSVLMEPRNQPTAVPPATDATAQTDAAAAPESVIGNEVGSPRLISRIALRTTDRIWILDPPTGAKREYKLPDHVSDRALQVYATGNEQLLLHWWDVETRSQPELVWLAADGSVTRRENVTMSSYTYAWPQEVAIISSLAAPIPIMSILGTFVLMPATFLQNGVTSTYVEALAKALEVGWLSLIATPLISAVMVWWTYRLQRKYYRPATGIWCAFVFLLGWPGFLAYWIEQCRPKLESCQECGTIVPRDREACATCNTEYLPPPRLGTEIFA
jgi:hypothetical protein